ncbi:hypothetical protein [Streptomyces althioticus]|uniref:hypothetical protein n=1 Tax=Streptomyces althioticus TaxID=83380 RepID=UPI00383086D9
MKLSVGRLTGIGLLSGRLRRVGRTGTFRLRSSLAVGHSRRVGLLGTDRALGCRRRIRLTGSGLTFGRLHRGAGALVRLAGAGAPGARLPRDGQPRGSLLRSDRPVLGLVPGSSASAGRARAALAGRGSLRTGPPRSVPPREGLPRVARR